MSSNARIAGIDAARGCAMVLVCLSHVREHFVVAHPPLYTVLTAVTRIATPTFLLLSGFVIAHLLNRSQQSRVGLALVDRGLFLLLVGHMLLSWASFDEIGLMQWLFGRVVITDAIGVSLCVAVLVRHASARALLTTGASLALLSWPVGMMLTVDSRGAALLGSVLFSLESEPNPYVDVALVPYVGLFLIGMGFSRRYSAALERRDSAALSRHLFVPGAVAVGAALLAVMSWRMLNPWVSSVVHDPQTVELLRHTVDPRVKFPPSPGYLSFYGGAGLLMASVMLYLEPRARALISIPATIGRASLMAFVVQDWLLRFVPEVLGLEGITSIAFWVVYLAAVLLLLYVLARCWDAARANRFLSVGLKALPRREGEGNSRGAGSIMRHGDESATRSAASRRRADAR